MKLDAQVVIVGGGPAGSTTALALAHDAPALATRTILLEKAKYPRDKPCAGAIGARGDALLRQIGVSVDVESAPIDGMSFRGLQGSVTAVPGEIGRVVRRREFDHSLARLAAARGIRVRDGIRVDEVVDGGGDGVEIRTAEGTLHAAVVVGCDGVGSLVRRSLGTGRGSWLAQAVEVDTEPLAVDADRRLLRFDASDRHLSGYAWDFPTVVAGRSMVSRGVYQFRGDFGGSHFTDVGQVLAERLVLLGLDPERYPTKRYAERGYEPSTHLARGGRMLVGEAAGIDPLTGEGIAQAIEYGLLAGRFLARRVAGAGGGAIDVSDWQVEVQRSRLAWDLRMRGRFVPLFYGPQRRALQRFFVESSSALSVGARHFGAGGQRWREVVDVAARGLVHAAGFGLESVLARTLNRRNPS